MHYLIISFSHKNSDIKTREDLAFNDGIKKEKFIQKLLCSQIINEIIILSTCNRIEIITNIKDVFSASDLIFDELSKHSDISKAELEGRADVYEDNGAVHHLFSVCSSLDSLVVGETQITGQLKEAFRYSMENSYCSKNLSRAMHFAFKCAKDVRTETDISKNRVSVASTAVAQAKDILGELGGFTAVVVGAGEMSRLAMKHLVQHGCNIILVNRDQTKAEELANEFGDMVFVKPLSKLTKLINSYKLLFCATGAPHAIVTKDMVEEKEFKRYWFDIAMPRDIDEIVCENIDIYAVDDLQSIVDKNLALREEQAKIAFSIIGKYTMEFFRWLQTLDINPVIKDIREKATQAIKEEVARSIKKGFIPKEFEDNLEKSIESAFNRFLHSPTLNLKKISDQPMADSVIDSVKLVFDLEEAKLLDKYKCEQFSSQ
jgi:glutamyl-tRNA reductase